MVMFVVFVWFVCRKTGNTIMNFSFFCSGPYTNRYCYPHLSKHFYILLALFGALYLTPRIDPIPSQSSMKMGKSCPLGLAYFVVYRPKLGRSTQQLMPEMGKIHHTIFSWSDLPSYCGYEGATRQGRAAHATQLLCICQPDYSHLQLHFQLLHTSISGQFGWLRVGNIKASFTPEEVEDWPSCWKRLTRQNLPSCRPVDNDGGGGQFAVQHCMHTG